MSKKNKTQRVLVIVEVLEKWGKLDFKTLKTNLAAALGEESDANFERALYRDMEDLVREGRVIEYRFTRDNIEIPEYDPDIHKNTQVSYCLFGHENSVRGELQLKNLGADIFASKIIRNEISILNGKNQARAKSRYIYFGLGADFFCLEISADSLPVTIFLSRTNKPIDKEEVEIISKKTQRFIILKLPSLGLSSFKDSLKPSHCSITLGADELVIVEDYKSSNGTSFCKLSSTDAEKIKMSMESFIGVTIQDGKSHIDYPLRPFDEIKERAQIFSPSIIQCSDNCRLLIM